MTTEYQRGDVVEASDPFDDDKPSRPFVIVNTGAHPFHGEQYVAMTLTTRSWYDETIALSSEDFVEGGLPKRSFVVPWGISSPQHTDIETYLGRLSTAAVDAAVREMVAYVLEDPDL